MENTDLMRSARESLRGKWGLAIGTFLIYTIILGSPNAIHYSGGLLSLIIGGPFALGAAIFAMAIARGQEARLEMIFQGFNNFTNTLVTYLLILLYVLLWSLLLIVPGIIAALSYSMSFYILADHPELKPKDVLQRSREMMDGYKMKLFQLLLWFLLLSILCVLTLGIGFLWLIPFTNVTLAKFYDDINHRTDGGYRKEDFV